MPFSDRELELIQKLEKEAMEKHFLESVKEQFPDGIDEKTVLSRDFLLSLSFNDPASVDFQNSLKLAPPGSVLELVCRKELTMLLEESTESV